MAATAQVPTDKLANFPAELRALSRWVCWKYETRGGKPTKVPYCPDTHRRASSTDSSTWTNYSVAVAASSTRDYAGVGFMFSPPNTGVDFDHCRDVATGVIEPWAAAAIGDLNTYTEISPSGSGLHCIVKGSVPPGGNRRGRVEMYDSGRYFTVTGEHLAGTPLTVEARDLTALHARMIAGTLEVIPRESEASNVISFESATKTTAAKPSREDLIAGCWQGYYGSQSQADLALCGLLVEDFGGDVEKIDTEFRASGLFREKWDERRGAKTYGERTIARAVELWRGRGAMVRSP